MTSEPTTSAGDVPAAGAATRSLPKLDQRFIAPILITAILLAGHYTVGILESPLKTGLAIGTAILLEVVLGYVFTGRCPHLASAYISGISVGILVRSPFLWPYALCSAISIVSKYVIRVKGRHIWNPSNFGISAMLFLAPQAVASLSIQWDNKLWAMAVVWMLGSYIIGRLKRFHICLTYVLSFLAFALVRSVITGHPLQAEIAPITGPMYQLFIFFMITDPKATVQDKKGQIATAFCVALVECLFRLAQSVHAPFYALFIVGPIAMLIEIFRTPPRDAAPSAPGLPP